MTATTCSERVAEIIVAAADRAHLGGSAALVDTYWSVGVPVDVFAVPGEGDGVASLVLISGVAGGPADVAVYPLPMSYADWRSLVHRKDFREQDNNIDDESE